MTSLSQFGCGLQLHQFKKMFKYDVFLSFPGEDTRKNFVDHLYHALVNKGIVTYRDDEDDENVEKGEKISERLIRSIKESRFYIIVFSKTYASSSWCLEELVKIMECQKMPEHIAYPVFYDVEPTEVRNQSGAVGKAFAKHVEKESAVRWRDALREAAGLAGWELKNGHESLFLRKIVEEISGKLFAHWRINEDLVGMENRVNNVLSYLEKGFNDVQIIGIKGMSGSGKTALAEAVFDRISVHFEGNSFVNNVAEVSKIAGLMKLQRQILSDVLNDQSIVVTNTSNGKNMMKKMIRSRKALVVLDNVDDINQLEALAGEPNWFKPGSRIIITTRDEQLLLAHRVKFIHDVKLLSHEEAILLLRMFAFGERNPFQGYEELSRKIVRCVVGLPSTIRFLGSYLHDKVKHEWEVTLERLRVMSLKETLELCNRGLEDKKEEFLDDDACTLKRQDKYVAMRILEIYGADAQVDSRIFKMQSSIMVSDTDHLCVHNHVEEVDGYYKPNKHKRLRITEETKDTLVNNLGIEELEDTDLHPAKGLKTLEKEHEFLYVDDGQIKWNNKEVGQYLPNTLRSLYWCQYPFRCLPKTFQGNNLINLEMTRSNISQIWEGEHKQVLENLIFLDLSNSKLKTFDLAMTPNLETLRLEKCFDFKEIHMPFECPKLKFLNLTVSKLSNLNLGLIPNLEGLYLEECNDLVELHIPVKPPKLKLLELSGSEVSNTWLTQLLEKLECLEELTLSIKKIKHLPNSIYMLKHLKSLKLKSCFLLEKLPEDLDKLERLEELYLMDCTSLQDIPNNVCKMKCLKYLHLPHCILVKILPEELGRLKCLKELNIEGTRISHLPHSILRAKGLSIVWSKMRLESYRFSSLKEISSYTASCYV